VHVLLGRVPRVSLLSLSGGISSGKSTVTTLLRTDHRYHVIDFDVIARDVVSPTHPSRTLQRVVSEFGPSVIREDGSLDRESLGRIVFADSAKRAKLSSLMRPAIWRAFAIEALRACIVDRHKEIILDVPLLFEAKLNLICSETILVYVNPEIQQERLMKRDSIDAAVASQKIAAQWSLDRKKALADIVIDNSGTLEQLEESIGKWLIAHKRKEARQRWWRSWVPTPPVVLIVTIASPLLLALNFACRWMAGV